MEFRIIGVFSRGQGIKMVKKQRLALAISAALLGTGCSTTSSVKAVVAGSDPEKVTVHHISYKKHPLKLRQQQKSFSKINKAKREGQLDEEINALALKLGLGSHASVGLIKKKKTSIKPRIRRAIYRPHNKVINKVVARREILVRPAITSEYSNSFEREVNRLYAPDNLGSNPVTQFKRNSVWAYIKTGYRLENKIQNFTVQRVLTEYGRNPGRLNRIFSRSSKYLYFITNELKRRGMPTELAFLPMVESAYINTVTPNADTAGLWQFRVTEGKRLGLKKTYDYDERLDVFSSTRVALTHLQKLHHEFKGDWYLALAAYNAGSSTIHREIDKNRRQGLGTDYWSLNLSQETREYIPRLLAYKEILNRPQAYGLKLPETSNQATLAQASVNKSVDLRQVARKAGLPKLLLTGLNPALKDGITKPQLSRQIIIPKEFAGALYESIKRTPPVVAPLVRVAKYVPKHKQIKTYQVAKKSKRIEKPTLNYYVRPGDNLYNIALKHGTTVAKLMRLNEMKNSRLKIGRQLVITVKGSPKYYTRIHDFNADNRG